MTVHYSIIDERFTRNAPRRFEAPLRPKDRSYTCHLFSDQKTISIAEDGRLLPCTSNAQRHAAPVIRDLDRYAHLPDDLAVLLDETGERRQRLIRVIRRTSRDKAQPRLGVCLRERGHNRRCWDRLPRRRRYPDFGMR